MTAVPDVATSHTADDFATFFCSKVSNICRATANAPLPVIAVRSCSQLSAFDDVSAEEVLKIVTKTPTKHCYLDPAPSCRYSLRRWLRSAMHHFISSKLEGSRRLSAVHETDA